MNEYDKIVSIFVGYNIGLTFDKKEVEVAFKESKGQSSSGLTEYAALWGIDLKRMREEQEKSLHTTRTV